MIRIAQLSDINWVNLYRIVYQHEPVELNPDLLQKVDDARDHFNDLIARGVPCYGMTTGLGKLVELDPDANAEQTIAANTLRERATACGAPMPAAAARAMLVLRLVNFLSCRDGVSADLCRYLVDRLNDGFTPWVPLLGHGMAADATANSHAFQTMAGIGYVINAKGRRKKASKALAKQGVEPFDVSRREALALINGICGAPAFAFDAYQRLRRVCDLANLVAAVSIDGIAAPRDSLDPAVAEVSSAPGVGQVIEVLRKHLNHSEVVPVKLQSPVSYRIVPQVHGALVDALAAFKRCIEDCFVNFSDNPMRDGDRILSVGLFHNQHLVNQGEQVALAMAHVGSLSERRFHRLLDPAMTGLNAQLAQQPGIDAGLVAAHKASVDVSARLRVLAQPVSLYTEETSAGQEDYMSMAFPVIDRLYQMADLLRSLLAYELLGGITAVRMRAQKPGDDVAEVERVLAARLPEAEKVPPGRRVEAIIELIDEDRLASLTN